jgi:hypothetical protein
MDTATPQRLTAEVNMDDRIHAHSEFGIGGSRELSGEPTDVSTRPWRGLEQTLASVVLGGVAALSGPTIALLIHILQETSFRGIGRVEVGILGVLGTIGGLFVVAVSVFGLVFGIMGMLAARRYARSAALALSGVFLCSFDALMWLGLVVVWILAVVNHR